jgi:hypothetical protein
VQLWDHEQASDAIFYGSEMKTKEAPERTVVRGMIQRLVVHVQAPAIVCTCKVNMKILPRACADTSWECAVLLRRRAMRSAPLIGLSPFGGRPTPWCARAPFVRIWCVVNVRKAVIQICRSPALLGALGAAVRETYT